ncbi:hypothetical protein ACEUDB_20040 [Aeromonas hydrophila]|uniref:hypothetical protein n=1 Tax=Aeromonas hydrophila TaxID=644 RepID=UPI0038D24CB7
MMAFSKNEEEIIYQLSDMLDELLRTLDLLGENTELYYRYIRKVRHILNTKDPKGMRNVKQHLMMDFRMIEDRQLEGNHLDDVLEKIYYQVSNNKIFKP